MKANLRDPAYLGTLLYFERAATRLSFAASGSARIGRFLSLCEMLAAGRLERVHANSFHSDWRYWLIDSVGKEEIGRLFLKWLKQASKFTVIQQT